MSVWDARLDSGAAISPALAPRRSAPGGIKGLVAGLALAIPFWSMLGLALITF